MKARILATVTVAALLVFSCKDDEKIEIDTTTYHPSNNFSLPTSLIQAESFMNDIFQITIKFTTDSTLWRRATYPKVVKSGDTIDIDFGDADTSTLYEVGDIRNRSGEMRIVFNGDWGTENSTMKIDTRNLTLSHKMKINGKIELANRGLRPYNSAQCPTYEFAGVMDTITVFGGDTTSFIYSSFKTYYMIQGNGTPELSDDIYVASGTAQGKWGNKNSFNLETLENKDFRSPMDCNWFTDGSAKIYVKLEQYDVAQEKKITFEKASCSPYATLYVGNDGTTPLRIELP